MSSKYWIKLYHEILHDPKMGKLPDRLWRRAIELFLMAGETADDGTLPPVADMAWTLRISEDELTQDLEALANSGVELITQADGEWYVTKFADRQAAVPDAERQKRYRERQRKQQYYNNEDETPSSQESNAPVTERNADTESESDSNTETDSTPTEANAPAKAPSPQKEKSKTPKQEASQAMFSALATLCKIDWQVCTDEQRGALNSSEKKLRKVDATPADLGEFHRWWYTHDWRGKKNREAPEPHQVREEWGRFTGWREEITPPDPVPSNGNEPDPLASWWQLQLAMLNPAWSAAKPVSKENGKLVVRIAQPGPRAHLSLSSRLEAAIKAMDGVQELEVIA